MTDGAGGVRMSNLSRAVGWLRLGGKPFPCYEVDTWVGDKLHPRKSPRTKRGFYDGFDNENDVITYWTENPEHLVGIWCGPEIVVLDIDKKLKFDSVTGEEIAVDGQFHLDENDVEVPDTFSVVTSGGGEHRFYRNPGVANLGGDVDIVLSNGVILEGVDRRAGSSYFIAWSDEVPDGLDDLAVAPDWLLVASKSAELSEYGKDERLWFGECPEGPPDYRVMSVISRIPADDFNHNTMRNLQYELVRLATEGHPGVPEALYLLREAWLREPWNKPEWVNDWNATLAGAIRKYGAFQSTELLNGGDSDESFERDVEKELHRKKVQMEAELRLLASEFEGSKLMTLEQMQDLKQDYLVESLIPVKKGVTALVAKRNIGKTFAYLSMVLCMVFGMPWMGKKTVKTNILIVLGEGSNGFYDRIVAWCAHNERPLEEVAECLYFIDGANLSNPISLKRIKESIQAHNIGLCILDTWAATSGVVDEDKAAVTSMALNRLQEAVGDASVLIVHHPNKSTENSSKPSARGSTALEGRADVVMTITEDKKYKSRSGLMKNWIQVSTSHEHGGKNRGAPVGTIRGAYLEPTEEGAVWLFDESSLISEGTAVVRQYLKGPMTIAQFALLINKSESAARRYLKQAVAEGVATEDKPARANEPSTYRLSWPELMAF